MKAIYMSDQQNQNRVPFDKATKKNARKGKSSKDKQIPANIVSYINRAMNRKIELSQEVKYVADQSSLNVVAFNSGISANADAFFMANQAAVGTGEYNRIGDQIQDVKIRWSGCIGVTYPFAVAANFAFGARVMLLRAKNLPIATTSLNWTSLLQGASGYNSFAGNQINLYQPINSTDFEVFYDKVFHFRQQISNTATQTYVDNESLMQYFEAVATRKGKVLYEEGTNNTSWNPFLCIGYAYEDWSNTIDTVTTNITACGFGEMWFRDA